MKTARFFKDYLEKILFLIYFKNFNFNKVTVLCYNVTPVILYKYFNVKSYIFSNHGIAKELYEGLIRTSENNILFVNQNNIFIKFLPKKWNYIYHVSKQTYKSILKKNSFTLITAGSTYKTNNKAIAKKILEKSIHNQDSLRLMNEYEHICCKRSDKILSIGTNSVVKDFKEEYKNKKIFQIKNSSYLPNENKDLNNKKDEIVMVAGRGSYHKGVDLYFDLAKLYPNITFNLIHLYDLDNALVPPNVIVHGFVLPTNPLFSEICKRSKVSCFFSISEGYPGSLCDTLSFKLLPLVPKKLGLELSQSFEYDDFKDMTIKFENLINTKKNDHEKYDMLELWKKDNISIEAFRLQLNEFLTHDCI